jgi:hypothetical protein
MTSMVQLKVRCILFFLLRIEIPPSNLGINYNLKVEPSELENFRMSIFFCNASSKNFQNKFAQQEALVPF